MNTPHKTQAEFVALAQDWRTRGQGACVVDGGPATVITRDTMLFADTRPPGKDYRIEVTLPMEKTTQIETNTAADLCGFGIRAGDGGSESFDWPGGPLLSRVTWTTRATSISSARARRPSSSDLYV